MERIDRNKHQLPFVTFKKYSVLKDLGENWNTFKVWDFAPSQSRTWSKPVGVCRGNGCSWAPWAKTQEDMQETNSAKRHGQSHIPLDFCTKPKLEMKYDANEHCNQPNLRLQASSRGMHFLVNDLERSQRMSRKSMGVNSVNSCFWFL